MSATVAAPLADRPSAARGVWQAVDFFVLLGIALFIVTALRAMLVPEASALRFGLPLASFADTGFVQVYGSRNLALALIIGGLVVTHRRDVLSSVFLLLLALPVFDVALIASQHGWAQVPALHYVIEGYFLIANVWLRKTRA